jgi:hypothetical protein
VAPAVQRNQPSDTTTTQSLKWKFRRAGIFLKSETGIYRQKKWKKINGYNIY